MTIDQEANTGERLDATAPDGEADLIRATERERLRDLLTGDMEAANQLHADDFQLINPGGQALSKEQYLGGIASGDLKYLMVEPDAIAVRLSGDAAVIRYQSQLQIVVAGTLVSGRFWHTDWYEKHDGRWRAVWSQGTR